MANITLHDNSITTSGSLPAKGTQAPDFLLAAADLSEKKLASYGDKIKVCNIFPSVDTGTCAASVRSFYQRLHTRENVVVLNISKDLPFALGRFCGTEGLKNVESLSAFRSSFAQDYGLEMTSGPLASLCSRAVIILSPSNEVIYTEQVGEITNEPDYAAVEKILDS